jgi:hypothetical protein
LPENSPSIRTHLRGAPHHVPDRYEHLVRYVGWYSNRARGERAKARNDRDAPIPRAASAETVSELAQRAKAAWARLIRKVYEADPLQCPKCKGPMRVIALIDHPGVIRHILEHLGPWAPEAPERGPPGQASSGRRMRSFPWPITRFPTSHSPARGPRLARGRASRPAAVVVLGLKGAA